MKQRTVNAPLNMIGEFKDKSLEHAYFEQYAHASHTFAGRMALALALFFVATSVFYFAIYGNTEHWVRNTVVRGVVLLIGVGFYLLSLWMKNSVRLLNLFMGYVLLCIAAYLGLMMLRSSTTFAEQALVSVVIVFASFMIPGRWVYSLGVSLLVAASLFAVYPMLHGYAFTRQYYTYMLYVGIAIAIAGHYSLTLHRYRRIRYAREHYLEKMSQTDRLTNTNNRQLFDAMIVHWTTTVARGEGSFCLVMIDLDDFKVLNDTRGHVEGDRVLVELVRVVQRHLRDSDILARWGGEEFMILLPGIALHTAEVVTERLRGAIEQTFEDDCGVTASFGVTECLEHDSQDSLLRRVDENLYKAKVSGKNCVICR